MSIGCAACGHSFSVTARQRSLLDRLAPAFGGERIALPDPILCPRCREQRRLAFRNERTLFRRTCSLCRNQMIAMFPPDCGFPVYCNGCWWSDSWDPLSYGEEVDLRRPFPDQLAALLRRVPLPALVIGKGENCDYTNYTYSNKSCYLLSSSDYNEDCLYSDYLFHCRDCVDCLFVHRSELLYECIDCKSCYNGSHLQNCRECRDCCCSFDCRSCSDCLFCAGLRNEKYCILNERLGAAQYEQRKKALLSSRTVRQAEAEYSALRAQITQKHLDTENCSESTGNHLLNCRSCENCFDLVQAEECSGVSLGYGTKHCMDCTGVPKSELCFQCAAAPENYGLLFSAVIWPRSSFLCWCLFCRASQSSFGCVSLKHHRHCILNRQYSEQDYNRMVPKLIASMRSRGEWGEFIPPGLAPFGYSHTAAAQYYPLDKEQAAAAGFSWSGYVQPKPEANRIFSLEHSCALAEELPAPDISGGALTCRRCLSAFRITRQEIVFYSKLKLALPAHCPEDRRRRRFDERGGRELVDGKCSVCKAACLTIESSQCRRIVCEECYLASVR